MFLRGARACLTAVGRQAHTYSSDNNAASVFYKFVTTPLVHGAAEPVPPGCSDALLQQLYPQARLTNLHWQATSRSNASLQRQVASLRRKVAYLCSKLISPSRCASPRVSFFKARAS